jgi:enoyl-CoA hydratase/carnithine racemase
MTSFNPYLTISSFFDDFVHFFTHINHCPTTRVIIITAKGKHFCTGLDLKNTAPKLIKRASEDYDQARVSLDFEAKISHLQNAFQLIERCRFPVLCGVNGSCIGGAIDMIAACDIVYCTQKANFSIKEIDVSIIADMGTLNRLPLLTNNWGLMKELCLTGRFFKGETAKELGLVSR